MRFESELFGDLKKYQVWSDTEELKPNDTVTLVNFNCEFPFDNITGTFENHDLMYCHICELEIIETDLSQYEVSKSNNGGAYAFAECRVKRVLEKTY